MTSETLLSKLQELQKTLEDRTDKQLSGLKSDLAANQQAVDTLLAGKGISLLSSSQGAIKSSIARSIDANTDNFRKLAQKEIKSFQMDLKAVGDMAFSTNFGNASASVADVRSTIIEGANRPLHVRDLIPKGRMSGSNFIYLKENGSEGNIGMVAEGTTKPQIDFDVTEITVPAEFVAGWLRISSKMLDDIPSMRMFLQNRLMETLLVVEDNQLLNGLGTSPNLKGINITGNFTAATGSATIDVEQLVQGIAQLAALGRQPDGIILNPSDYYSIMLNKAVGSGEYDVPAIVSISDSGVIRIAGVPVVWTIAQTAGTFTIGDFAHGSALLFREDPRIEYFMEDGTNVRENKITIRIEERIAFAVFANTYFVKGSFV